MDAAGASVLITPHRFSAPLRAHYEAARSLQTSAFCRFRNDAAGPRRARRLAHALPGVVLRPPRSGAVRRSEILDAWPERFGATVLVLENPGVNLRRGIGRVRGGARCLQRALAGSEFSPKPARWGQRAPPFDRWPAARPFSLRALSTDWRRLGGSRVIDYGVMPGRLRQRALRPLLAGAWWRPAPRLAARRPGFDFRPPAGATRPRILANLALRNLVWQPIGCESERCFSPAGFGLGRRSGRALAALRRVVR